MRTIIRELGQCPCGRKFARSRVRYGDKIQWEHVPEHCPRCLADSDMQARAAAMRAAQDRWRTRIEQNDRATARLTKGNGDG
jgi:hypothetical protein